MADVAMILNISQKVLYLSPDKINLYKDVRGNSTVSLQAGHSGKLKKK